jgi:hypothetical protein
MSKSAKEPEKLVGEGTRKRLGREGRKARRR